MKKKYTAPNFGQYLLEETCVLEVSGGGSGGSGGLDNDGAFKTEWGAML